ncbi:MAG: DsrE/DsrF/DrsH-like family protein [Magnetococcales bacterium]|nr:DsrE/DsrF/DrsH-like family protein [Magnetococcales bacterium]
MANPKRLTIIASKGTLDFAYPPLILATTAATLGYEVTVFWTFYGLQVLRKERDLKLSPLGNPAMPMPIPMPAFVQMLPGMEGLATLLMKQKMVNQGVPSIDDLLQMAKESKVKMVACQMTVDLFGFKPEDFIDGLEYAGAARFFEVAENSMTLFI